MESKIYKIFKKDKNIIIGAIHFPPLLGYKDFPGLAVALKNALLDLKALESGGVDGIIFENNYDIPHKPFVDAGIVSAMTFLGGKIKLATKLPVGINVLWNDYRASLSIAKVLGLQFIRVPVFVDRIKTDCGVINGQYKQIIDLRKKIKAENVALMTDIHVKHAKILSKKNIFESAKFAIESGSDALIITGKWTGQAPDLSELTTVREAIGKFPILTGSGADKDNIKSILEYANGVIVSTSLKEGRARQNEINVKTWRQRIDENKVRELLAAVK